MAMIGGARGGRLSARTAKKNPAVRDTDTAGVHHMPRLGARTEWANATVTGLPQSSSGLAAFRYPLSSIAPYSQHYFATAPDGAHLCLVLRNERHAVIERVDRNAPPGARPA